MRVLRATLLLVLLRLRLAASADEGPVCPNANCVATYHIGDIRRTYKVKGATLVIQVFDNGYMMTCSQNISLDSEALPRFTERKKFKKVKLVNCSLPTSRLKTVLDALNVQPLASLELADLPSGVLSATLLTGLTELTSLYITAALSATVKTVPKFLDHVSELQTLWLIRVAIEPATLLSLPVGLDSLQLFDVGLTEIPGAALRRLHKLRNLNLQASLTTSPDFTSLPRLRSLTLSAHVNGVTVGPALSHARLYHVRSASIDGNCGELKSLLIKNATEAPPLRWLEGCPKLAELEVDVPLGNALTADMMRGAVALRKLVVRNDYGVSCCSLCKCEPLRLSATLLTEAPALRELVLMETGLDNLPKGLFGATLDLEALDLSNNKLTAESIETLAPFTSLKRLNLARNPLGDLCASTNYYISNDLSPLRNMVKLEVLELQETQLTQVCKDWRQQTLSLKSINLSANDITELRYEDLQWKQDGLVVNLNGNNVTTVRYTEKQYESSSSAIMTGVTFKMNSKLTCDCQVYWLARAMRERAWEHPVTWACREPDLNLIHVPLRQLQCVLPRSKCAGCSCTVTGEATYVTSCIGISEFPRVASKLNVREIHAAGNLINRIQIEDLPMELEVLDLRDNKIEEFDLETVYTMFKRVSGRIMLGGNPLACTCDQRPVLNVLLANTARLDNVTCSDGRALVTVVPDQLCTTLFPAAIVVPLGVLLLVVVTYLLRRIARARIKKYPEKYNGRFNWLLSSKDRVDSENQHEYDAFIFFSHHDDKFLDTLVGELERKGRRLCLPYRDWSPGVDIPIQIKESVRHSRTTVVVLSESFLRYTWACAKCREAYAVSLRDKKARPLVILLADPPVDFPKANYIRHNDPRLWKKMLRVVPFTRKYSFEETT